MDKPTKIVVYLTAKPIPAITPSQTTRRNETDRVLAQNQSSRVTQKVAGMSTNAKRDSFVACSIATASKPPPISPIVRL